MSLVLVLNSGSSSLKYACLDVHDDGTGTALATGSAERIGEGASDFRHQGDGEAVEETVPLADHEVAMQRVFTALDAEGLTDRLDAVGHRVVHGGATFSAPVRIDDDVVAKVAACVPLAPLHNPANLLGIRVARGHRPDLPQVAVFDTAFHATMPPAAFTYAIPTAVAAAHEIRRYGFHGTSHAYVARAAAQHLGRDDVRLVTLHLGNGASMAAVRDGDCVDTTMGMSPLEGLVMGTRSGDLDPSIVFHLARVAGMSLEEVETMLNKASGLKGLCAENDLRAIASRIDAGDVAAAVALDVYVHRIRRYVGAFLAVLGGADALVFTAGVGENSALVRARVCADLTGLGIELDPARNDAVRSLRANAPSGVVDVATPASGVRLLVVPTDEELEIARQTVTVLRS